MVDCNIINIEGPVQMGLVDFKFGFGPLNIMMVLVEGRFCLNFLFYSSSLSYVMKYSFQKVKDNSRN